MKKEFKSIMLVIIVAIVIVPIVLNYLCLTTTPIPIVGDGKIWIVFWGSYLGGIMAVLSTMYVLYKNHQRECRRKEYEIQKERLDLLCRDMGKLCSTIDMDILCSHLMNMAKMDDANKMILEIGKLEQNINCEYNEFCLKHAHNRREEGEELINAYKKYSEFISSQISIILTAVIERQTGKITDNNYNSVMSRACKELESLGDIRSKLFGLANKWKEREWYYTENLRDIFING